MAIIYNVLVVDDNKETEGIVIVEFNAIFRKIKNEAKLEYDLHFQWARTIPEAKAVLNGTEPFDVVLVDYDFSTDELGLKGVDLVREIRDTINTRCKIVFYTMKAFDRITKEELVDLINNDVFKLIDKSGAMGKLDYQEYGRKADQYIVEAIIEAIACRDPFSKALEGYLVKYYDILKGATITIDGKNHPIQDVINQVRLDRDAGKRFVSNMIEMSIVRHLHLNER